MSTNAQATLLYPFESGALPMPDATARVLFHGALPDLALPDGFAPRPLLVQGFRPFHRALVHPGFDVSPTASGQDYDLALVLCGRHRGWSEGAVADALRRTRPGGVAVVAGAKDDGIAALRKRFAASLAIDGSLSKHHGIVFWMVRPDTLPAAIEGMDRAAALSPNADGFLTAPGMFSHETVDAGSLLLAQNLPTDLSGDVADFCAGWGFLARHVASHCGAVRSIDLYEADHASLQAAERNLAGFAAKPPGSFWQDLALEPVQRRYDVVVMNPPFHYGRAAEPGIGQQLIRAAASALRPGGALHMVANRNLPYEAVLASAFRKVTKVTEAGGFKVLAAIR